MAVRFGTDGVRGRAISELSPEDALSIGRATARVLGVPRVVIGRDTRRSGPVLEAALAAGLAAEGVHVDLLGVLPTPAVAWLAREERVGALMVTASHNPWWDNGIKVFAAGGRKLDDGQQAAIERWVESAAGAGVGTAVSDDDGGRVGVITHRHDAQHRYAQAIIELVGPGALHGMRLVVDAANGAAGPVSAQVFEGLGAEVAVSCTSTRGDDINADCGATHPQALAAIVQARGADLGLAFDGDGDRVIAVDHIGRVVDGDRLIALSAVDRHQQGRLPGSTVVVTVMTNLGFHRAMRDRGLQVITTAVGDRQVLEAMEQAGSVLGGEQSGHIIHRDLMPSGDGLLAGALLAALVRRAGRPLADLAAEVMTTLPQVMVNVRVADGQALRVVEALRPDLAAVEEQLGDEGRVVLRPSGTEPLVRVMVEATSEEQARSVAEHLADRARQLVD